jgi:hypothetical protein
MDLKRLATLIGFVAGAAALALQFILTVAARLENGDSIVGAVIFYFAFFTIISNLMLVLIYLSDLSPFRWLDWWRKPTTRAMFAAVIVAVAVFNHVLLSGLRTLDSWDLFADTMLHYILPAYYVLWWVFVPPHVQLSYRSLPWMMVYPVAYLVWALVYGGVTGTYPYPTLDVGRFGVGQIAINVALLFGCFIVLYAATIALDGLLGRTRRKTG